MAMKKSQEISAEESSHFKHENENDAQNEDRDQGELPHVEEQWHVTDTSALIDNRGISQARSFESTVACSSPTKANPQDQTEYNQKTENIKTIRTTLTDKIRVGSHSSALKSFDAVEDFEEGEDVSVEVAVDGLDQQKDSCWDNSGDKENANKSSTAPAADSEKDDAEMSKNLLAGEANVSDLSDDWQVVDIEEGWEMVGKIQLGESLDGLCLSGRKRNDKPPDEDNWEIMEKDHQQSQNDLYKSVKTCLSGRRRNCNPPNEEADGFVFVEKPDGFAEYSEFGQNSQTSEIEMIGGKLKKEVPLDALGVAPWVKLGTVTLKLEQDPPDTAERGVQRQAEFHHSSVGSEGANGDDRQQMLHRQLQMVPQEVWIHMPCSEPHVQDYWLQMLIQDGIHMPCSEPPAQDYWQQIFIQEECGVIMSPTEKQGETSETSESVTEGGRLLTFCTEDP